MKGPFINHYLYFTAKERSGILVLLSVIVLLSLFPFAYLFINNNRVFEPTSFNRELKALAVKKQAMNGRDPADTGSFENKENYITTVASTPVTLFQFDPNTLDAEGWTKLGIREKTAATIQKYISKGGRFRKPEDIGKIWGLSDAEVKKLIPYVRIQHTEKGLAGKEPPFFKKKFEQKKEIRVDINMADTSIWIALPGIGPGFAKRIVNFRTRLGGFYAVMQVSETYGMPDSTFQKIKPYLFVNPGDVKKININTATVDELKTHPYIRYNLANVIVNFRKQHGNFLKTEDIKKIMILDDETYLKLQPYLTVD
ncbi:MAG: helix-hairpin-helix domain-containing protein [Ferruginibacter sp.]